MKLLTKSEGNQMTIFHYDLEKLVSADHALRKIQTMINFKYIANDFKVLKTDTGRNGYGLEVAIKSLFLQFYYDMSDRETEERLRHDNAFKWFCDFKIDDDTPDHTFFCRTRKILGTEKIAKIFRKINKKAEDKGIMRNVFTFVDASKIITKETTWAERDKALKEGEEALNNSNIKKYSADKDARFGCNGKNKFWFGYKKHNSVDMGSGLIKKVAVTPANISDAEGLKHICPYEGMVFADKGYCVDKAQKIMKSKKCHSGAIMKNNMNAKNKDKDKWISRTRSPFENVFSKDNKRARYRGLSKIQMQAFMDAIVFNVKRLLVINAPPLFVTGG